MMSLVEPGSRRVRVFSCRILDFYYTCVFFVFPFCVVVLLYPGVVFRVRACVGHNKTLKYNINILSLSGNFRIVCLLR
jgi:hypothetical protein